MKSFVPEHGKQCVACSTNFSMTLQTEILSIETFHKQLFIVFKILSPIELRKAKIVYNFGLSEFNRVNSMLDARWSLVCLPVWKDEIKDLGT